MNNRNKLNDSRLQYLLATYDELRNEIKLRIQQRDNLAIQYIVSLGVLSGIAFTEYKYTCFAVLLIPLITIFFSVQIFSSYSVHDRLVKFIREHIEVNLGEILEIEKENLPNYFWEQFCEKDRIRHKVKNPGSRKFFFQMLLNMIPFICGIAYFIKSTWEHNFSIKTNVIISLISIFLYFIWSRITIYSFEKKPPKMELKRLSKVDYINRRSLKSNKKLRKAVFFDRDGTLHVDKVETTLKKGLDFFPDTISVLKEIKKKGYLIIVITNQSGIGKKHITYNEMKKFNKKMRVELSKQGCDLDAIYFCPHTKEDHCICFKPNPGMILRAKEEFNIDLCNSYFVGDKTTDIEAAKNAGIPKSNWFLVTTGIYKDNDYKNEPNLEELSPNIINNLSEFPENLL